MSTWSVYKYNTGTLSYDLDGTIPRPQSDLAVPLVHNQKRMTLVEGDDAFITPAIKTSKQNITMVWFQQTKTFVDQIETWMNNNDYLKIVTHLSSYNFIGKFISINPIWLVGQDEIWDVEVIFEIME